METLQHLEGYPTSAPIVGLTSSHLLDTCKCPSTFSSMYLYVSVCMHGMLSGCSGFLLASSDPAWSLLAWVPTAANAEKEREKERKKEEEMSSSGVFSIGHIHALDD